MSHIKIIINEDADRLRRERFEFWIRSDHGRACPPQLVMDTWAIDSRATRSKWVVESFWSRLTSSRPSPRERPCHPPLTDEIKKLALDKLRDSAVFVTRQHG